MATVYIDHKPYDVDAQDNLLHVCLSLGVDLPYFCWHPALGSVGACRQCAVKQFRDEKDTQGRIVMSCMTPAADGTRISVTDAEARAFRASVIEWLMVNHPHDCPVCDEGGHCHLQDMTLMTGHTSRRHRFQKRTFRNQDLGPFLNHEMNRCIQCYRCVRFYRDYAGGRDLHAFAIRNHVYFGRHTDGVLENEFSGNLVEVCPTGVFTDKTLSQHYTRKWDLQMAPSLCVHCGLGCNTIPAERYGLLRRIENRYHSQVNGYFLCDRGRFGYDFVNSQRRLRQPLLRREGSPAAEPASAEVVLHHLGRLLAEPARVLGIGSPRASLEANFALRTLVGPERFSVGMSDQDAGLMSTMLDILRRGPARTPSLREVELADAVLVLGEDVINTAPRLALALRQSVRQQPMQIASTLSVPPWHDAAVREVVQHETGPLFLATPAATRLDDIATQTYHAAPADLARLGYAVARALGAEVPPVTELPDDVRAGVDHIAQALQKAQRPLVISGSSCGSEAMLQAAANVAWALCNAGREAALCLTTPECNSLGVSLLGGSSINAALQAVQAGVADTVIVLENDLSGRLDAGAVQAFLDAAPHLIVIDHLANPTTALAEVVLPAATFAESDGTLVSNEGRAQRFFQVFVPDAPIQESWRWLRDMLGVMDRPEADAWQDLDDVIDAMARAVPVLARLPEVAPLAAFRMAGMKKARQPGRYSGRTAMHAQVSVHEPKPPDDPDAPLAFSMEGYPGQPPSSLIPFFWAPGWNSPQAINRFQSEVGGPLRGGDPGLRLLEPAADGPTPYFRSLPAAFTPRQDAWLVVTLFHIFGSEELSVAAPAIAERSPRPCLMLHPDAAAGLQVGAGDAVILTLAGTSYHLPVRLDPSCPVGMVGLLAGLPPLTGITVPAWGTVTKARS